MQDCPPSLSCASTLPVCSWSFAASYSSAALADRGTSLTTWPVHSEQPAADCIKQIVAIIKSSCNDAVRNHLRSFKRKQWSDVMWRNACVYSCRWLPWCDIHYHLIYRAPTTISYAADALHYHMMQITKTKCFIKTIRFQLSFKTFREGDARMSCVSLFYGAGSEYEKARSPNLMRSLGRQQFVVFPSTDRS